MNIVKPTNKFRKTPHSKKNQIMRLLWQFVYVLLFRPSPRMLHKWRIFLLRIFGAKIGPNCKLFPTVRIWAPWNLVLGENCSIGDNVNCYCVTKLHIDSYSTVSQDTVLSTASHEFNSLDLPLLTKQIFIGKYVWICADVFVMQGVSIGDGAVIGARSTVFSDIPAWMVAYGTPCKTAYARKIN